MTLRLPPPLRITTVVGAMDNEGRKAAGRARTATVSAVKRNLPARSGNARKGTRGSVKRTPVGYEIVVAPSKRVRYRNGVSAVEVTRWLEEGTGIAGPRHAPIVPRKGHPFRLPGGFVSGELRGQAPQHPYGRAAASEAGRVSRILEDGADLAADAIERAVGGR